MKANLTGQRVAWFRWSALVKTVVLGSFLLAMWLSTDYSMSWRMHRRSSIRDGSFEEKSPPPTTSVRPPPPSCAVIFQHWSNGGSQWGEFLDDLAMELGWGLFRMGNRKEVNPIQHEILRDRTIATGHLTPAFLEATGTEHCLLVTTLRAPVDRVVDALGAQPFDTNPVEQQERNNRFLACFRDDDSVNPLQTRVCWRAFQYQNNMVRLLSSETTALTTFDAKKYVKEGGTVVDAARTEKAKEFLSNMDLVCFSADMDNCFSQIRKILGVPPSTPTTVPSGNRKGAETSYSLSQRDLNYVQRKNEYDQILFDWAKEHADQWPSLRQS